MILLEDIWHKINVLNDRQWNATHGQIQLDYERPELHAYITSGLGLKYLQALSFFAQTLHYSV